jgi:hypothetical protein
MSGAEYIVDFQEPVYEPLGVGNKKPPKLEIVSFIPTVDNYVPSSHPLRTYSPNPSGTCSLASLHRPLQDRRSH